MNTEYDLIVIGAGSGGLVAALGANYIGARVLLVEKEKLGGDCLNYGCVPSKSLIASAKYAHKIKMAADFGIHSGGTSVDFSEVINRVSSIINSIATTHDSKERFTSLGIEVLIGEAKFLNRYEIQVGNKQYKAKKFVIATGSSPIVPNIKGLNDVDYLTNLNVFNLKVLPKSLAVIGAGTIGAELSQAFSRLGSKVSILARSRLMSKEDEELTSILEKHFISEGIKLHKNCQINKVKKRGKRKLIRFARDEVDSELEVDDVLVAVGRIPNVSKLGLEKAGVKFNKKGVEVNSYMQTNVNNIYACGDVCGPYNFTHMASYQAGLIIKNAFTPLRQKANYEVFPRVSFTDPELAQVGMTEKELNDKNMQHQVHKIPLSRVDRAKTDGLKEGLIKILINKKGKILGVSILGDNAGELLSEYTLAMNHGLKIQDIYNTIHPYPVLSELNKFAAGEHMKTLFSPLMKKFLKYWNGFN